MQYLNSFLGHHLLTLNATINRMPKGAEPSGAAIGNLR